MSISVTTLKPMIITLNRLQFAHLLSLGRWSLTCTQRTLTQLIIHLKFLQKSTLRASKLVNLEICFIWGSYLAWIYLCLSCQGEDHQCSGLQGHWGFDSLKDICRSGATVEKSVNIWYIFKQTIAVNHCFLEGYWNHLTELDVSLQFYCFDYSVGLVFLILSNAVIKSFYLIDFLVDIPIPYGAGKKSQFTELMGLYGLNVARKFQQIPDLNFFWLPTNSTMSCFETHGRGCQPQGRLFCSVTTKTEFLQW